MNSDPANSLMDALSTATACWELANDAARDGHISTAMASTIARAALEAAAGIQRMLQAFHPNVSDETFTLLNRCIFDLETIATLAAVAETCESTTPGARHLVYALRCMAEMAANHLSRAEQAVM